LNYGITSDNYKGAVFGKKLLSVHQYFTWIKSHEENTFHKRKSEHKYVTHSSHSIHFMPIL
jgi:hypothetical protein